MNILKYKYKAHKLINTLFYVAVFGIGFILGFGTNKIDFNKLVSQVLMIDNVSATTIYTYNGTAIDEDFIYERFMERSNYINEVQPDFDISVFPYIYCNVYYSNAYASDPGLNCVAFKEEKLSPDNLVFYYNLSSYYGKYTNMVRDNGINENPDVIGFNYRLKSLTYSSVYPSSSIGSTTANFYTNFSKSNVSNGGYTTIPDSNFHNTLDFSKYSVKLEYNENLFKDNPDFKEVCVSNYDTFSITSNSVDGYDENEQPYYHSFDFMWFPNGMKGVSTYRYDTEEENHVYIFEESETTFSGWWYWLNTKEEIDLYFGRDNPGLYLELRGYTDKYKYYNYTMYPFEMAFTPSYHYYPVFWFKDPYIEYLDGTKKDDSDKYCFYIKNEYDVNILNHDSMGDVYGDVTILGGTISSDSTSKNLKDMDNSTLVNTLYNLLNRLKNTINFINYHIESLFFSMPLLFQMFIVSVLLIFAIKLIINMIIK